MLKELCLYVSIKKKTEHLQHIPVVSVLGKHSAVQKYFRWPDWDIFSEQNNQMQQFSQN